jgi:SAM-dependent methyltransferase
MGMMRDFGGHDVQVLLAELYDYTPPYLGRGDLAFYLHYSCASGGKILELGCGTGRILVPTAAAGCEIVGLDDSTYMLARCRDKLRNQPRDVQSRARLLWGNMAQFDARDTFSLVTAPFRSFQHLISVEDQLSCLETVNRHLHAGGTLILDFFQVDPRRYGRPSYMIEVEDFPEVELPDGRTFRRAHRIVTRHRAEQYNDIELIYYVTYPNGKSLRLIQEFPLRYLFRYEAEHLLERTGFEVVEVFGDFDKSELSDDSPEMIFVVEKRDGPVA